MAKDEPKPKSDPPPPRDPTKGTTSGGEKTEVKAVMSARDPVKALTADGSVRDSGQFDRAGE